MADPIIQSVTPNFPQGGGKFPGQQMSIDVVATDADAHTIDMTLRVSPGHEAVIDPANPLRIWLT